ncbi:hypothetical protein CTEN210_11952 [Chaetoceros tenuissimus]|uniref:G-protein coupled receptors family 1 profile domain-containing protein n=1 Tax=Chaetoceros tenuissimus TaxID=426638 RepID=A0AAD3D296_9STRA|nr:hypothetical protein CTEN210_11952 [Chaetoceros tenuissimus]
MGMNGMNTLSTGDIIERVFSYIFSFLSLVGGSMIISSVFRSKQNRENIQQKIVGLMSVADVAFALLRLTGMFFAPRNWAEGNLGNSVTCNIQGFAAILVWVSTLFYSCSLALYYLLVIRYNWKSRRLLKVTKYLYFGPPISGLLLAVLSICFNGINFKSRPYDICFSTPSDFSDLSGFIEIVNIGGVCTFIFMVIFNAICIFIVYFHVRKTERRSMRWNTRASLVMLQRTKQVSRQFQLFTLIFLTPSIIQMSGGIMAFSGVNVPLWYSRIGLVLLSSSGFLNAIVYFRIRNARLQQERPDWSKFRISVSIVNDTLFPCAKRSSMIFEDVEPSIHTSDFSISDDDDDMEVRDDIERDGVLRHSRKEPSKNDRVEIKEGGWQTLRAAGIKSIRKNECCDKQTPTRAKALNKVEIVQEKGDWRTLRAAGVRTIKN